MKPPLLWRPLKSHDILFVSEFKSSDVKTPLRLCLVLFLVFGLFMLGFKVVVLVRVECEIDCGDDVLL